jgi:hypothetical protein
MSTSARQLGSIATRDTVDLMPCTPEFRARAPDTAPPRPPLRVLPFLDDVRSTCGPLRSAGATERPGLRGSQDSHNRPFGQREVLTHDHDGTEVQHS